MSDFESDSYNQSPRGATPIDSMTVRWWRRGKDLWLSIRSRSFRSDFFATVNRGISALSGRKIWVVIAVVGLLVVPIVGVFFGYVARPKQETAGSGAPAGVTADSSTHPSAKPAPGKPLYPVMQPLPTDVVAPTATPPAPRNPQATVPPQEHTTVPAIPATPPPIAGAMPPPPVVTPNSPYTPVTYPARHDKHFGDSCSGQLTLSSRELVFQCPEDPRGTIQVAINQIDAVDDNGIRLTSGKKYHFSIAGMSKSNEQALFSDWFNRVR